MVTREKEKPEINEITQQLKIQEGIKLRDFYFGGRTNGLRMGKKDTM